MAGQRILDPFIGVRIPAPEPSGGQSAGNEAPTAPAPTSPRATLVRALLRSVDEALGAGDTKAARVALDALNALVEPEPSGAGVVHLSDERAKRWQPK
jgi:hypothetical protein